MNKLLNASYNELLIPYYKVQDTGILFNNSNLFHGPQILTLIVPPWHYYSSNGINFEPKLLGKATEDEIRNTPEYKKHKNVLFDNKLNSIINNKEND